MVILLTLKDILTGFW